MNDRQLRYALAVWRERSFSRAADRLNISQPSVSEQVRLLEEELGFPLFQRTGRGIEVTYPGRTFLHQAEQTVSDLLRLSDTARQLRGGPVGAVGMGFSTALARIMIPRVLAGTAGLNPYPRLEVTTATTRRVQRLVFQGRLDLGLTIEAGARSIPPDLMVEPVGALELGVLTPREHALARSTNRVPITRIAEEPLILNEPDIGYGEAVMSIFADQGLRPNIAAVCDDMETVKLLVAAGVGVAIAPFGCAGPEVATGRLSICAIQPRGTAALTLVSRKGPHEPLVDRLIGLVRDSMSGVRMTAQA